MPKGRIGSGSDNARGRLGPILCIVQFRKNFWILLHTIQVFTVHIYVPVLDAVVVVLLLLGGWFVQETLDIAVL